MGRPKKIVKPVEYRTFEQCIDIINTCINKRKHRWTLTSISFMDFDDVAQLLRSHIYNKWHLYDQSKKLESWLTTVINHRMINIIRDVYSSFSRPCLKCEFFEGDNLCSKFGTQNTTCDLYKAWVFGKKRKYDIQIALPMENHINECQEIKTENMDIDKTAINLHEKMKHVLKPLEYFIYKELYINHKNEDEVGKMLKLKSSEKNRSPGYSRVSQLKKIIIAKVKEVLKEGDVEIVGDSNI
jgi:hypothetical protein